MKVSRKLVVGAVAGLAVAGGGAAIAATQLGPKAESQAIINDAAGQLGVKPSALSDALKNAYSNRIDAAVKAGQLTKAQGDAIKAQIQSGNVPLVGHPGFGFRGPGGFDRGPMGGPGMEMRGLDAAASYLGLSQSDLLAKLKSGKSLADVAKDQGKSVDGLVQALVADAKSHLDQAVKDGRLSQSQEDQFLTQIKQHITDAVNGNGPPAMGPSFRGGSGPPAFGPGFRGGSGPPAMTGPWGPPSFRQSGGTGTGSGASA